MKRPLGHVVRDGTRVSFVVSHFGLADRPDEVIRAFAIGDHAVIGKRAPMSEADEAQRDVYALGWLRPDAEGVSSRVVFPVGSFAVAMRLPQRKDTRRFWQPPHRRVSVKLKRGDKIVVVATDWDGGIVGVAKARVIHAHRGRVSARSIGWGSSERGTLYRRQEGRTWAVGWDTPEAMALSAEVALLVSQ